MRGERLLVNVITVLDKPWRAWKCHSALTSGCNSDTTNVSYERTRVSEGSYTEIIGSNWKQGCPLHWSDKKPLPVIFVMLRLLTFQLYPL